MAAGASIRLPLCTARQWPAEPPTDLLKASARNDIWSKTDVLFEEKVIKNN
jgi:hypothetical protein